MLHGITEWGNDDNIEYDSSSDLDDDYLSSYEELSNAFNDLHDDIRVLVQKIWTQENNSNLTSEVES